MKKIYFTLIGSCLVVALFAQKPITLNWQILDDQLNPVSYVSVTKKSFPGGIDANRSGEFSIEVTPGKDTMVIQGLGYEPLEVPITEDIQKKWIEVLEKKLYILPEMVISGRYYETETRCCLCTTTIIKHFCPFSTPEPEPLADILFINKNKPKVRIFPIPTNNAVSLQQSSALGMIDLFNLNGQKLQSFNFGEQLNASIDLSNYPAGTYLLRSNQGWVEKVVLQK